MPPYNCGVDVFLKEGVASPEAATIGKNLARVSQDLEGRVGKFSVGKAFKFVLESPTAEKATSLVTLLADKMLANPVLEEFSVTVEPLEPGVEAPV